MLDVQVHRRFQRKRPWLNGLNPKHYFADVLARIAELLPRNWQPLDATRVVA
jgi:hypothetical protein